MSSCSVMCNEAGELSQDKRSIDPFCLENIFFYFLCYFFYINYTLSLLSANCKRLSEEKSSQNNLKSNGPSEPDLCI